MIESLLLIAILLPIALPPIVKDATIAVIINDTTNKLKLNSLDIISAIDAEVVPLIIPQILEFSIACAITSVFLIICIN